MFRVYIFSTDSFAKLLFGQNLKNATFSDNFKRFEKPEMFIEFDTKKEANSIYKKIKCGRLLSLTLCEKEGDKMRVLKHKNF